MSHLWSKIDISENFQKRLFIHYLIQVSSPFFYLNFHHFLIIIWSHFLIVIWVSIIFFLLFECSKRDLLLS